MIRFGFLLFVFSSQFTIEGLENNDDMYYTISH
jgi:hypothetical protein